MSPETSFGAHFHRTKFIGRHAGKVLCKFHYHASRHRLSRKSNCRQNNALISEYIFKPGICARLSENWRRTDFVLSRLLCITTLSVVIRTQTWTKSPESTRICFIWPDGQATKGTLEVNRKKKLCILSYSYMFNQHGCCICWVQTKQQHIKPSFGGLSYPQMNPQLGYSNSITSFIVCAATQNWLSAQPPLQMKNRTTSTYSYNPHFENMTANCSDCWLIITILLIAYTVYLYRRHHMCSM